MACCCNNQCCCPCRPCRTCFDCKIRPVSGCPCNKCCEWYPIEEKEDPSQHKMRVCCDENGCCGLFPEECRNTFWPDFAHPRWLCCQDLYCARKSNKSCCCK